MSTEQDSEMLNEAAWALSRFSESHHDARVELVETGVLLRIADLIDERGIEYINPCARILHYLAADGEHFQRPLIDCGVLRRLLVLMGTCITPMDLSE
jgi:hypothetical protein